MKNKWTVVFAILIVSALAGYYGGFIIPELTRLQGDLDEVKSQQQPQSERTPSSTPAASTKEPSSEPDIQKATVEPDVELAKSVINSQGCGSCHTLKSQGLNFTGTVGPDLTATGLRNHSDAWLRAQLTNPTSIPNSEVVEGYEDMQTVMPSYNALSEEELMSVIAFLQGLKETDVTTNEGLPKNAATAPKDRIELAKTVIQSQGCGSCHTLQNADFDLTGQVGPDLSRFGSREKTREWLIQQLNDPTAIPDEQVAEGFAGMQTVMPSYGRTLSDEEMDALVDYLMRLGAD